jgi:hypothetical protein
MSMLSPWFLWYDRLRDPIPPRALSRLEWDFAYATYIPRKNSVKPHRTQGQPPQKFRAGRVLIANAVYNISHEIMSLWSTKEVLQGAAPKN